MTLTHTLAQKALEARRQGDDRLASAYWAAAKNTIKSLLTNRNK